MKPEKILFYCLVVIGGLIFLGLVIQAILFSWREKPAEMSEFANWAITGIGAVLATNLGAVLGVKIANREKLLSLKVKAMKEPAPTVILVTAAIFYSLVLLVVFVLWWFKFGFETDPNNIVPIIPNLSKTFIGVIIGAMAVALNFKQ